MSRQSTNALILVIALFAVLASPAGAALPALSADADPARGGRIVDAAGREVLLRGANVDLLTDAPALAPVGAKTLRATGWNAVRVLLSSSRIEPEPGKYDDEYLAGVERLVDALAAQGVYSVLAVREQQRGPIDEIRARGWAAFWRDYAGVRGRYVTMLRHLARRFARQPGIAGLDVLDSPPTFGRPDDQALGDLYASSVAAIRAGERDGGGGRRLIFVQPSTAGPLPPIARDGLVFAPQASSPDALAALRERARLLGGAPVVLAEWPAGPDAVRHQDAQNGLRLGAFVATAGAVDPRGPLTRAYVRAAPGRLEFSHYEEARGHFATRGVAPKSNEAPVEIFYPQGKHRGARFRARGLANLRAVRAPGGGRLVYGVPTGRWSFQIGPQLK